MFFAVGHFKEFKFLNFLTDWLQGMESFWRR